MTKNPIICLVSGFDAREPGREIQFVLDVGCFCPLTSPPTALALSPFQAQLYKPFNTTFKLMVFLLEKKKIKD